MEGNPAQFEAIGNRLGFRIVAEDKEKISLLWQGARFPAFLCLGIASALLFISIPILEALRQRGFEGPAASLWYFPIMNLILLGIASFLLSLKRTILFDHKQRQVSFQKRNFLRSTRLRVPYAEITAVKVGTDEVYNGFAVAGSSAAERYPIPSLRLVLNFGKTVLLDRGGIKRLAALGKRLSLILEKPLQTDEAPASRQKEAGGAPLCDKKSFQEG